MFIYKITNILNNKSYIGQTIHENPNRRIKRHFQNFKPKHKSIIWDAIHKYGKENFIITILQECSEHDDLNTYEQLYITKYNTLNPNGYNLQTGGQFNKFTDETKRKISESQKGHTYLKGIPKSEEHRKSMSESRKGFTSLARIEAARKRAIKYKKSIKAININTLEVIIFNSITEASVLLKIPNSNISKVCKKKENRSQAGGYKFEYL